MLSILLCLTMLLSCVPTAVFAAEGDSVCTCQTKCAEGSVNTECTVCSADLTACIAAAAATLPRYLYVGGVTVVEEYTVSAVTSGEGWRYDTATATLYLTDGAAIRYTSTTEECLENGLYCSNGTLKVHASGTVSITGYGDGIRLPDGTLELYAAEGSNITITGTSAGSEGIYSTVNTNSIRISGKGTVNVSASDGASYGMTAAGNIYIDGVTLNVGGTSNYDDISAANVLIGQTEAAVVNCLGPTCSGIGGTLTQKVGIYNGSIVHLAEKTTEKSWLLGFHAKTIEIADSTVVMDGLTGAYSIYAMHGASTVSGASHILIRKMVSTEDVGYGLTVGYDSYQLTGEAGYYTRSDAAAEFTADGDITEIYIGYFELYYPSHMSYHSNGDGTHYYGCPATCPAAIKGENEECSGTATCAEPVVCESCGAVRQLPHSYDNEADTDCNACGALRYDIWVAGVRVTEENASDVLGDGTVSYDGAANTLTLNGATVDASALAVPALEVSGEPLTLVLQGTNALTGSAQVLSSVDEAGNTIWYGEPAISIAGGTVLTITGDETATLTLLGNDFAYTANDHIPSASSISGGSLNVAGGTITTNNGIRLSGDYSQTGGSVEAGFLEAQNVTVSDGILNAKGNSGICPKYADPHAGGIHGIFANNTINISGGNVTTESGIVGHNGDYCGNMSVTGETITTHGLYALESVSITGGTVTSTGCVGGYVIDPFGFLTLGHYTEDDVTPSGPAPGSALEAPDWSISEEATFICGSETSHRGGTATCTLGAICDFCGAGYGETDTSIHDTVNAQYTNGFCDCCGIYDAPELVDDVYQIGNAGQLYWFAQQVNSGKPYINAVLTADITINKNVLIDGELNPDTTVVNGFRTWTPIGKGTDHSYYGSFDGQNHSISGLYYQGGDFYVGLFGYLSYGAVVKNLKLTDSYFNVDASGTSHFYAGGIAASLTGGRIENCRNEANLRVNYDYSADVGGIVGFVSTNGTVSHCRNSGKLHGGNTDILSIGGIVGTAVGVITDCGNTGDIIVDNGVNTIVGGVSNGGTLENCFNTGSFDITSTVFYPGGISGRSATVTNCYYLMGVADEGIEGEDSEGAIQAMSQEAFASGEVAYLLNGGVTDGTQSWYQTIGTDATPELSGDTVYYGYTGCMDQTIGYGKDAIYETAPDHVYSDDGFCQSGCYQPAELITEENYTALGVDASYVGAYAISNAGQLYWYAALTNGMLSGVPMDYYASGVLLADLDLEGRDWIPIGLYEETIDGIYLSTCWGSDNVWDDVNQRYTTYFDGRGHTISNFNAVGENSQGLFGYIYCASILNLTVKNATASGWNAGAIAGYPYECLIENCSAIGCTISGETATEDSTYSIVGAMTGSPYGYLYNSFAYDCTVLRARAEDRLYALGGLEDDGYVYNSVYSKVRYGYVGDETLTEFDDGLCMTEENMVSGYVAYLLSQGYSEESYTVSGDIWGQTLGTDACPVLGGQTVYQVTDCQQVITYSNTQHQNGTHVYENGFCIWYDCYEPCGGSGTAEDPYTIANAGQLYWFAAVVNEGYGTVAQNTAAHAKLTADIVVNEGTTNARVWVPIGVYDGSTGDGFGGIFDGDHHTVSGLYYPNDISYVCVALFRCLKGESAEIRNVGLLDSYFYNFAGAAIVGYNEGGTVKNCYNASKIHAGHNAAGIVGRNKGLITYCYNTGEFPYHPLSAGGIAVENYGTISNCYNAGDFVLCNKFGGIACENFNGVIRDCYNTGELHGTNGGGITYSGGTVTNCYSTGRVSCLDLGSGIATKATVENCYYLEGTYHSSRYEDYLVLVGVEATKTAEEFSSGEVAYLLQSNCEEQIWGQKLGEEEYPVFSDDVVYQNQIGGCTEENFAYEYSNTEAEAITTHPGQWTPNWEWDPDGNGGCYVSVELHCDDCGELVGFYSGDAQLISEVKPINCQNPGSREWTITFTVQDREFTDTYTEVVYNDTHISFDGNGFCTVCGGYQKPTVDPGEDPEWDYDDVYLIYNAGQLYWFANHVNNVNNGITGKLMADIDLNPGYTFYADGTYTGGDSPRMWTPIGGGYPCYAGNFDGNGFTVSGAYTVSEGSYVGLFGNTDYNYTIENLGITNSYFEGADHVGGLIGYAYTIVKNCYVTDTVYVSGDYDTAALIGYNGGEVYNSYAMADTFVDTNYGSCYNCYALTENDGITAVTAEDFVSGKVAYLLQSGVTEEDIYDEDWNWIGSYIPEIWGQTIGEDDYPVLKGAKVYEVTNCKDETAYSNTNAALGHNYVDGTCTVCGSARPATVPTLTAKNVSLSFEDEILVNVYFTAADAADVKNYGLLLFSEKVASPTFDTAIAYTEGWYESKGYLGVTTPGIAAKNMGDTLYFAVYAVLADGTYAYSKTYTYAPTTYAYNMLGKSTTPAGLKPLIVAMLNYGAAAQVYFNYNTDNLVNAKLTDEQKALVVDYNGDMLDGLNVCMDDKKGELFGSGNTGFDKNTPSVNFEGAFSVNLYFGQPKATVGSDVTFYVWDKATYESVETLLPENAIATSKCTFDGTYYVGIVEGIAAKEVDETFYCAAVYTGEDGNTYVSGVISYSLGYYLENQAAGTAMPEFAQATGVYAYYAKTLFNA